MKKIELQLIAQDGWRLRELLSSADSIRGGSILGVLLLPIIAFYLVEVSDWSNHTGLNLREYDQALRTVRARLKVFEDKKLGLNGLQALIEYWEKHSTEYFNKDHSGFFGRQKTHVQDDLALYFVGLDLISTSHLAFATASFLSTQNQESPENDFPWATTSPPDFSIALGHMIGDLTTALQELKPEPVFNRETFVPAETLYSQDVKAKLLYKSVERRMGFSSPLAGSLAVLISQVNFIHRWGRFLFPNTELLNFRIRYLTASHALTGVKNINAIMLGDRTTQIGQISAGLLESESCRRLRKMPSKLRSALAHYTLSEELDLSGSFDGLPDRLVEHYSGESFSEVDSIIDDVLEKVSSAFRGVYPRGPSATPVEK